MCRGLRRLRGLRGLRGLRSFGRSKHRYLPHRSRLALEMAARACPGAAGALGRAFLACFGVASALKMAAQACPGPARVLLERSKAPFWLASASPVRSKWPLKPAPLPPMRSRALKMAAQACPGAANALAKAGLACCSIAHAAKMNVLAYSGAVSALETLSSSLQCRQCTQIGCSSLLFEITIRKCWSR